MTIKINDVVPSQTQRTGEGRATGASQGQGRGVAPTAASSPAGDSVSITQTAQQLNELHDALAKVPVVDGQRVEQLRAAIDEGRYQVDPMRVADKLLRFEEQL